MTCPDHSAKRFRARELRLAGWSRAQIARELGVRNSGGLTYWIKDIPAPVWTRRPRAKDDMREQAIALRREGRSYREIQQVLGVSKSSLSLWLRDVALTDEQRVLLATRSPQAAQRRAASLRARRIATTERIHAEARSSIGRLTARELLVAGILAYWAEGAKSKPWSRSERVEFTNSDPTMITLFLRWLELVGVPRSRLTFQVQIHERADVVAAERFWLSITAVPRTQFRRTILKRHNPKTVRKNTGHRYVGCLRISVQRSTELYRRIVGWYEGIMRSLGPGVIGSTPPFDGVKCRFESCGPSVVRPSTLFEPSSGYEWQRVG